ncbi:MAG: NADH-quinone oxidoreductase subunit J [Verrucomicrobiales bacterium]
MLFYLASALMLGFGVLVVLNRNPVASALSLVVSFVGLAALFILLDAHFLGIIQILVYAGAVMVLFLFIIMLFDLKAEKRRKFNVPAVLGGGVVAMLMVATLLHVLGKFSGGDRRLPELADAGKGYHDVKALGLLLFDQYPFHLQVVGVLLLTATIGVIVLSKKEVS